MHHPSLLAILIVEAVIFFFYGFYVNARSTPPVRHSFIPLGVVLLITIIAFFASWL